MKYVTGLILLILLCFTGVSDAGIGTSYYSTVWDITVSDCYGKTVVYKDCAIIEMNEQHIVFIPEEGRISTNGKRKIVPINSDCMTVIMDEK
jgi:hypothetical protein